MASLLLEDKSQRSLPGEFHLKDGCFIRDGLLTMLHTHEYRCEDVSIYYFFSTQMLNVLLSHLMKMVPQREMKDCLFLQAVSMVAQYLQAAP